MADFWHECYDRVAREKLSPEDFQERFCSVCKNQECERTGFREANPWFHRIATQKERLLDNPMFADPSDPTFDPIRDMEFQSVVRDALRLEIADQKGDWSIPTEVEINQFASTQTGIPQPPRDLIDEVTVSPAPEDPPKPTSSSLAPPSRFVASEPPAAPQPTPPPAPKPQAATPPTPTNRRNPGVKVGPEKLASNADSLTSLNTSMPTGGIMLGGPETNPTPKTAPKPHDPWAIPASPKETVIPVGGKIVLGGGKKDGK